MDCPYCSLEASDQKVVFRDDVVWFVRDRRLPNSQDASVVRAEKWEKRNAGPNHNPI